jgi:hypothetical protein
MRFAANMESGLGLNALNDVELELCVAPSVLILAISAKPSLKEEADPRGLRR